MVEEKLQEKTVKLDKKDREILYQLDTNARQSNSEIAKKVHLSKEVIGYRIQRMANEGIIKGFYAVIDLTKLGYINARIFMRFKNTSTQEEQEILDYFTSHRRYWWVNPISGATVDLGVACWVKNIADFDNLKNEFLSKYRDKIENYKDSIYSAFYSWNKGYLAKQHEEKRIQISIPSNSEAIAYDDYDIKLLSIISGNARISIVELATKIGFSVTAIKYRLKKLKEQKILLAFRPTIDLAKLGYYWYKVEFQLEDYNSIKKLLSYFASHPNIVYAYQSLGGGSDLDMEMEVRNHDEFREVIDSIRDQFKDVIRNYIYYIWESEHKILFFSSDI